MTPAEIAEMHKLYNELGSYKAVAERLNRSPSTVSRYVDLNGCPAAVRHKMKELLRTV